MRRPSQGAALACEGLTTGEGSQLPEGRRPLPHGMFTYQIVVRSERVYLVRITCLGF
ncbi:hypothetical protein [Streptomyces sp. NPDC051132]|uniref:hypothetical protein n=1 Tax=unclassified Streptomyces TaxID=2593676 RepID=UPI00341574F9